MPPDSFFGRAYSYQRATQNLTRGFTSTLAKRLISRPFLFQAAVDFVMPPKSGEIAPP
jgi:hypothetical protein